MKKAALSILLIFALIIPLSACRAPMLTMCVSSAATPQAVVEDFFACLKTGDYSKADAYVFNYDSLGFGNIAGSDLENQYYRLLTESRSITVIEEKSNDGINACVSVSLTTIDHRKFSAALSERVSEAYHDKQMSGEQFEDDEEFMTLAAEIQGQLMQTPQDYYTTEVFDIEMVSKDGEWLIICSEALYMALIGYTS